MATGCSGRKGRLQTAMCEVSVTVITSERFWPG